MGPTRKSRSLFFPHLPLTTTEFQDKMKLIIYTYIINDYFEVTEMRKCPKCSLIHDDSVMKCTYCGYDFTEEDAVINEPVAEPVAESVVEAPAESPVETEIVEPDPQPTPVDPPVQNNGNYNPYGAPQFKYCPRCGNQCDPKAVICVKCGLGFENFNPVVDDNPSAGLKVLCFFFPIVGLILYLVNKDKKPLSAKAYGKWGLIGFIVNTVFSFVGSIISSIISLSFADNSYYYDDMDYYYTIFSNIFTMLK